MTEEKLEIEILEAKHLISSMQFKVLNSPENTIVITSEIVEFLAYVYEEIKEFDSTLSLEVTTYIAHFINTPLTDADKKVMYSALTKAMDSLDYFLDCRLASKSSTLRTELIAT